MVTSILLIDGSELLGGLILNALEDFSWHVSQLNLDPNELRNGLIPEDRFDLIILRNDRCLVNYTRVVPIIAKSHPEAKIFLIGPAYSFSVGIAAIKAGINGYFSGEKPVTSLKAAVKFVLEGETYVTPQINDPRHIRLRELTQRELQMIVGIALGLSNMEIANSLDLTEPTIKLHIKNLMRKLNARNRAHVAVLALMNGFLPREYYDQIESALLAHR